MSQIFQIKKDSYNPFLFLLSQRREITWFSKLCLFFRRCLCEEIIEVKLSFVLGFESGLSERAGQHNLMEVTGQTEICIQGSSTLLLQWLLNRRLISYLHYFCLTQCLWIMENRTQDLSYWFQLLTRLIYLFIPCVDDTVTKLNSHVWV